MSERPCNHIQPNRCEVCAPITEGKPASEQMRLLEVAHKAIEHAHRTEWEWRILEAKLKT